MSGQNSEIPHRIPMRNVSALPSSDRDRINPWNDPSFSLQFHWSLKGLDSAMSLLRALFCLGKCPPMPEIWAQTSLDTGSMSLRCAKRLALNMKSGISLIIAGDAERSNPSPLTVDRPRRLWWMDSVSIVVLFRLEGEFWWGQRFEYDCKSTNMVCGSKWSSVYKQVQIYLSFNMQFGAAVLKVFGTKKERIESRVVPRWVQNFKIQKIFSMTRVSCVENTSHGMYAMYHATKERLSL